jgi:hypothetical protein
MESESDSILSGDNFPEFNWTPQHMIKVMQHKRQQAHS